MSRRRVIAPARSAGGRKVGGVQALVWWCVGVNGVCVFRTGGSEQGEGKNSGKQGVSAEQALGETQPKGRREKGVCGARTGGRAHRRSEWVVVPPPSSLSCHQIIALCFLACSAADLWSSQSLWSSASALLFSSLGYHKPRAGALSHDRNVRLARTDDSARRQRAVVLPSPAVVP
jgi:hypothetical protein